MGGYDALDQSRRLAGSRRHKIVGGDKTRNNKKCGDEEMIITLGNHKDGIMKHKISKKKTTKTKKPGCSSYASSRASSLQSFLLAPPNREQGRIFVSHIRWAMG